MPKKKKKKRTLKARPKKRATKRKKKARPKKPKAKARPKKSTKAKKPARPKKRKKKAAKVLPWRKPLDGESLLGVVLDFFARINVMALVLKAPLRVGEQIHVRGHTTDLVETVGSIQIEHLAVTSAGKGDSVGIKISDRARHGDYVYKTGP